MLSFECNIGNVEETATEVVFTINLHTILRLIVTETHVLSSGNLGGVILVIANLNKKL